jgi:hypothetical protein
MMAAQRICKITWQQVYSNMSQSTDDAINYRVFDFALQSELKKSCDAFGEDVRNLFTSGMVDGVVKTEETS